MIQKDQAEGAKAANGDALGSVVHLVARRRASRPLTDSELDRVRAMLDAFDKISTECPLASRILNR